MRRLLSGLALGAALLALSACGTENELKPKPGKSLPVAPYGRLDRPASGELLGQSSQSRPSRNVELHTRSEPRNDDPFDLPPED
jgi:hypothetical protein